jgi:hypothetical protein
MLRLWGTHHEAQCGVENVYLRVEVSLFTPFMRAQQTARLAGLATSRLLPPLQDPPLILMVDLLSAIPFTRSTWYGKSTVDEEYPISLHAYEI